MIRDQRGMVLIVGLFASVLLFGMGWAVFGVGQAIRHGEAVSDAADAVAFSAAVVDARAMNLVALFNMVKVSVVAVSVTTAAIGLAANAALTFINQLPVYAWAIPAVTALVNQTTQVAAQNQPVIQEILTAIGEAEAALAADLPEFGEEVADEIAKAHGAPIEAGFVAPWQPLPLVPDTPADFCARVLPFVVPGTHLDPLPPGQVRTLGLTTFQENLEPLCLAGAVTSQKLAPQALLGTKAFQRRGYALAAGLRLDEDEGVRVAAWMGNEAGGRVMELRDPLSRVGLAQAELYFDGAAEQAELIWHLQWRARMRRFRDDDDFGAFQAGCTRRGGGEVCGAAAAALAAAKNLIVH